MTTKLGRTGRLVADLRAGVAPLFEAASPHAVRQQGAYAVVPNAGGTHLLILQSRSGRCYLPGGRLEPGEAPEQALAREIAEECSARARVQERVHRSTHLILDGQVSLEASYWHAVLETVPASSTEHTMLWMMPDQACARLHRPGDVEAVRRVSLLPES